MNFSHSYHFHQLAALIEVLLYPKSPLEVTKRTTGVIRKMRKIKHKSLKLLECPLLTYPSSSNKVLIPPMNTMKKKTLKRVKTVTLTLSSTQMHNIRDKWIIRIGKHQAIKDFFNHLIIHYKIKTEIVINKKLSKVEQRTIIFLLKAWHLNCLKLLRRWSQTLTVNPFILMIQTF